MKQVHNQPVIIMVAEVKSKYSHFLQSEAKRSAHAYQTYATDIHNGIGRGVRMNYEKSSNCRICYAHRLLAGDFIFLRINGIIAQHEENVQEGTSVHL